MESTKINRWFGRYAAFLLKWRWAAIALFVLILVFSFMGMSKMVQQTSFDDYFIEGDPMLVKTNEFKANFGNDYFVGILTESADCKLLCMKGNAQEKKKYSIIDSLHSK